MCIIIVKPAGLTVSLAHLQNGFANNPDGAGYMFVEAGKIVIKKFLLFKSFLDSYNEVIEKFNNPLVVIHFRLGTHGIMTVYNVHPFRVNDNLAFCHYGIISKMPRHPKDSDTQVFNNNILKKLPPNFTENKVTMQTIKTIIDHSLLVFLSSANKITFVNEALGKWDNKIWYSNDGYLYNYRTSNSCQVTDEDD
jgi:predicted glutamine amidotransferase